MVGCSFLIMMVIVLCCLKLSWMCIPSNLDDSLCLRVVSPIFSSRVVCLGWKTV